MRTDKKMKKTGYVLFILMFSSFFISGAPAEAEILHLKNGKSVRGKIIELNDLYVSLKAGGKIGTYAAADIQKIEADPQESKNTLEWDWYTNKKYGFCMFLPRGWIKRQPRVINEPDVYLELNRSRSAVENLPAISVMVSLFQPREEKTGDLGNLIGNTKGLLLDWKSKGASWQVAEAPHPVMVGNLQGVRMTLDYATLPHGNGGDILKDVRLVFYGFLLKDKSKMVTISLFAHGDKRSADELKEMEPALRSFILGFKEE